MKPSNEKPDSGDETNKQGESPTSPLAFQFLNEIGIIAQISGNMLERVLPDGMKMSHFVVLNHFVRLGGERTPQELARIFQVTKGAMTNTIQRLEAQGFISVTPDTRDQRSKRIAITPAGAQARQRAIEAIVPMLAEMNQALGNAQLEEALPLLVQLRQWLGKQRTDLH